MYPSGGNLACVEKIYDKIKLDIKMAVIVSEAKVLDVFVRNDETTMFDILKEICQVSNGRIQN